MELVDGDSESPTLISNNEVMKLLQKNIEERRKKEIKANSRFRKPKPNKQFRNRDWVIEEVHKYLETTPCVRLDPDRRAEMYSKLKGNKKMRQKIQVVTKQEDADSSAEEECTASASVPTGYNLTEAEALQIMNMMPSEPVEIHLMVDELQSRMSEERQEEFLAFIASYCLDNGTSQGEAMELDEGGAIINGTTTTTTTTNKRQNGKEQEEGNGKPRAAVKVKKEIEAGQTGMI